MNFLVLSSVMFSLGTALIAVYAELSKSTPYSSKHSMIRGLICICCIIFSGFALGVSYQPNVLHFFATLFIFSVSSFQFYLETRGKTFADLIEDFDELEIKKSRNI